MRNVLVSLILSITVFACTNTKPYKYIEVVEDKGISGTEIEDKDAVSINAETDSAAYLEAYKKFTISVKVTNDMKTSMEGYQITPLHFKLFNEQGKDIAKSVHFSNKLSLEKEIEEKIMAMDNNIQKTIDQNNKEKIESFKKKSHIDSAKIKHLTKYFKKRKDEFSNDNTVWYTPVSAPSYTNRNGLYCYFQTNNGMPSNLRFKLQYYSDDWLFFKMVQFSIDGTAFEYIPTKTETDSGDGGYIWEWFDEQLSSDDKPLISALASAKKAKMKLIGSQYHDIKTVSKQQILDINRTIELYKALGGEY